MDVRAGVEFRMAETCGGMIHAIKIVLVSRQAVRLGMGCSFMLAGMAYDGNLAETAVCRRHALRRSEYSALSGDCGAPKVNLHRDLLVERRAAEMAVGNQTIDIRI